MCTLRDFISHTFLLAILPSWKPTYSWEAGPIYGNVGQVIRSPFRYSESALVDRRITLRLHRHQLHRSPGSKRTGTLPEGRIPLDQRRLRADRDRVSHVVCRRTADRRPLDRRAWHTAGIGTRGRVVLGDGHADIIG